VANQGGNVAQSFKALAPTLHQTDQLSNACSTSRTRCWTTSWCRRRKNATAFAALDSLVGAAQQTLGTVGRDRQAMNDTLVQPPSTLATARGTLGPARRCG